MSRRTGRIAVVLVLGLVLAAAIAWLALPGMTRWLVVRQLESAAGGRRVTIERFDLDVMRGRLGIAGLRVADLAPGPPLAELDRLDARFAPGALLRAHLHVADAAASGLRIRIVRAPDGALNVADLLRRPASTEPPAAVTVDRLALAGGVVTLEDRALPEPRTWRAEGITVDATALSTVDPEPAGALRLAATVAGAPLSVDVTALRLAPLSAAARIDVKGVDATLAQVYLPADAPVVLDRAALTAALTAIVGGADGLRLDGGGRLENLVFRRRGAAAPVATVPALDVAIAGAAVGGAAVRLGRIEVTGAATLLDQGTRPATPYAVDRVRLIVDTGEAGAARVSLSAGLPGGGDLDVQGAARFAPLSAELRARARRVDLAAWASLAPLPGRLTGTAESDLAVTVSSGAGGVVAHVQGGATVSRLALAGGDRPLLSAEKVEVTGVDAAWPRVRVARVRAVRPTAAVERDAQGRISLMALLPPAAAPAARPARPAAPASPAAPGASAPGLAVEVAEIALEDAAVTLDDASVSPPARLRVAPIALTARDVTWPAVRRATLAVKATLPGSGTLDAQGSAGLDPLALDLRARVGGAALAPYQAYVPLVARVQGRLEADVAVTGALGPRLEVAVRGSAAVSDVVVGDGGRPMLRVARIETTGLDYAWPAKIAVDRLRVQRSWAMLERRADGSLPFRALFRAAAPAPAASPAAGGSPAGATPASATPALDVTVRESVLEDGAVTIADAAVTPAARIEITGARLEARDFTWPARRPVPVRLQAPMPGGGQVSAEGELGVGASTGEIKITLSGVEVAPVRPYLPVRGRLAGKASADLQVKMALDPLAISARGRAGLTDMSLRDRSRQLASAARVEMTGVEYTWPATAAVARVEVDRPTVLVERRADGSISLTELMDPVRARGPRGQSPVTRPSERAASPPAAPLPIAVAVREAVVTAGAATIVDDTVRPQARLDVADVRLLVRDLTWPARGRRCAWTRRRRAEAA